VWMTKSRIGRVGFCRVIKLHTALGQQLTLANVLHRL
jgi:hypothetical protein